jgi:hypothetical protein
MFGLLGLSCRYKNFYPVLDTLVGTVQNTFFLLVPSPQPRSWHWAGSRAGPPPVSEYMSPVATGKRKGFQKERQNKIDKKEEEGGERGIEIATKTKKSARGKILKTSRKLFEKHSKEKRKAWSP